MKIGIDSVDIEKFTKSLHHGGQSFLNQHYLTGELINQKPEHLAGIFAAKEAVYKTGFLSELNFHKIQVLKDKKGKPGIYTPNGKRITELDLSITHTDKTAIAAVIWTNS